MQPIDQRQCVYCLGSKPVDAFDREHIIPQAFGKFQPLRSEPPFVLDCVCRDCNHWLGNTLDRPLARETAVGLLRYLEGWKDAREFKQPPASSGYRVEINDGGSHHGEAGHLAVTEDGKIAVELLPGVGLSADPEGPFERYELDRLPTRAELVDRFGMRIAFQLYGRVTQVEFAAAMRERGFSIADISPLPGVRSGDIHTELSRIHYRAIAKIAFDYFVFVGGARLACMAYFDDVRAYIRDGVRRDGGNVYVAMHVLDAYDLTDNRPRRGHFLTVQSEASGLVSQVQLLAALRCVVRLSHVPFAIHYEFAAGHFFDLDTRRGERIVPPPCSGLVRAPTPGMKIRPR